MAARWSAAGAEYLHVVDLDGALAGAGRNLPAIQKILEHASEIPDRLPQPAAGPPPLPVQKTNGRAPHQALRQSGGRQAGLFRKADGAPAWATGRTP